MGAMFRLLLAFVEHGRGFGILKVFDGDDPERFSTCLDYV